MSVISRNEILMRRERLGESFGMDYVDGPLTDFIKQLQDIQDRNTKYTEIECEYEYGGSDSYTYINFYGIRPLNQSEVEIYHKEIDDANNNQKEFKLKQYEILKKELGL